MPALTSKRLRMTNYFETYSQTTLVWLQVANRRSNIPPLPLNRLDTMRYLV